MSLSKPRVDLNIHLPLVDLSTVPRKNDINPSATLQKLIIPDNFTQIITPSRIIVAGPSMAGKTHFIFQLVKYRDLIFSGKFRQIIYCLPPNCYNLHMDFINDLKNECHDLNLKIIEDMPDIDALALDRDKDSKLLIIDDLMRKAFNSSDMLDLITQKSHHANISVILTTQNIFFPSKFGKSIVRNCSTTILFWDNNDIQILNTLSMQMFPKGHNFLYQCFDWLHKNNSCNLGRCPYLVIDGATQSLLSREMRVRSHIFPHHSTNVISPIFFFAED